MASLFTRLRDRPSGHTFTVLPVPGHEDVFLGVDIAGHPGLFVRAEERALEPQLRTAKVSLEVGQAYSLANFGESPRSELLHALRCESGEPTDVDTFLVLADAFLARFEGQGVAQEALTSFFRSMVRLFTVSRSQDLQSERQGLWGELFVMRHVRGFGFWAPSWHSEAGRRFDFSAANRRVEVKTAVGAERIHHFSHRQIYALEGEEVVIASLLLREEDAGLSLREVIREARDALRGTEHYFKLEGAIRRAGMDLVSEPGPIYDATEAAGSLAWFRSTDAPHFRMPEPAGVSETRYKVDLSTAPRIEPQELEEWLSAWPRPASELTGTRRRWSA